MEVSQQAAFTIMEHSINIGLELVPIGVDEVLFNLRGTYWRTDRRAQHMYLVSGKTLDEALERLARSVQNDWYVTLDWRARLNTVGDLGEFQRSRTMPLPLYGKEKLPEPQEHPY